MGQERRGRREGRDGLCEGGRQGEEKRMRERVCVCQRAREREE